MANLITGLRIVFSIVLLLVPPFSKWFYIAYLLAGFSDMIDGTVARLTNSVSEFGAKLDTVADITFLGVCLFKLLRVILIPAWLWIFAGVIAFIKFTSIIIGFCRDKELVSEHTILNKVTGALLFCLPLTMEFIEITYSGAVISCIALAAAIQEGYYVIKGIKKY